MTKQLEALRLADEFDNEEWIAGTKQWRGEAAAELRRLHEVNVELLAVLNGLLLAAGMKDPQPWRDARADVAELLRKYTGEKE